jgi:phosphoribosyl 1,2-cyclic phosphodiesterase
MNDSLQTETASAKAPNCYISVCVLASGSKGNAIYISNGATSILLDAGLSGIEIERRLKSRGLSPQTLDAIIVSH